MGGTLVFRGTRVPAQTLLDYLDDHFSIDEFIDMFPSVQRDDAGAIVEVRSLLPARRVTDLGVASSDPG